MILGKPNKHTANDNTSGVVALCELWASLSDGDYIMVIKSTTAQKRQGALIDGSFVATDGKTIVPASASNTLYPSDQSNFPHHVALSAFKKNKLVGYYLDKIHTKHDQNFDRANLALICDGIKKLIANI